jgi:DNA replication protein DnaC
LADGRRLGLSRVVIGRSGRLAETLLRHDLVVIDEIGYLPFSRKTVCPSPR